MYTFRYLGDPVLRKKCKPVNEITPFILNVIKEMKEANKIKDGAGLAAPQIGYDLRIFINAYSKENDSDGYPILLKDAEVYIDPVITKSYRRKWYRNEACLSIPGVSGEVQRAYEIDIEYTNIQGERVVAKKEKGWRARCLQHEMDHLNGLLYIDHMTKSNYKKIEPALTLLEAQTKEKMNKTISPEDFII